MIHELSERIDEVIGRWPELYGCDRIEEIHNGFEWTDFSRHDCDSTYHLTYAQSKSWENQYTMMLESFLSDYKDKLPDDININNYWDKISGDDELESELQEYENEWFEPALIRLSVQDDYVHLSINYTDQPYYRYQYDETILKVPCGETVDETLIAMKIAYDEYLSQQKKELKQ